MSTPETERGMQTVCDCCPEGPEGPYCCDCPHNPDNSDVYLPVKAVFDELREQQKRGK
jgi:hypothetical protein